MTLYADEEIVMSSNNNKIVLTNKRIIQDDNTGARFINLTDYLGYEIINKRYNFYILAFLVCLLIGCFVAFFFIPTVLFLIFYFSNLEKTLLIKGNNTKIEFSRKELSDSSVNNFVQKIEELSMTCRK
jgi:uncharacterized membrane protein